MADIEQRDLYMVAQALRDAYYINTLTDIIPSNAEQEPEGQFASNTSISESFDDSFILAENL
ncbi:hypothetical protein N7478_011957 [Penicillium angulare]|uniref:uncharacterized protein n=1 Tax=Penicillium angulare TaxID=116970 RepID=UPI0025402F8C|nr:uncharacterized protein N7478_011957 [Penicillium angulare]KAJ5261362.1 hypothetical protein N7478_011957 [Penicillium angulare]